MIFLVILLAIISTVKAAAPPPRCPSNMVQYYQNSHICYWAVADAKSFDDAENFCVKNGGHLAPVFDQPTNFFIAQNAYKTFNATDFWIGGKTYNINDATAWLWTWYYAYFVFSDWSPGQGKPVINNCVLSNSKTALWSSADCNTAKPFVCQIPAVVDICDPEWSYFKGRNQDGMCYKYISQPNISFPNAQSVCSNENANLVSIHSKEENDFVSNMTKDGTAEANPIEGAFIGLQYINLEWKWVDGTDFDYQNWGPDRPQYPANAKADGALVYPDGRSDASDAPEWVQKWNDWSFDLLLNRFVCKKKPNLMFVGENLNINI